jgi:hypothetical protein
MLLSLVLLLQAAAPADPWQTRVAFAAPEGTAISTYVFSADGSRVGVQVHDGTSLQLYVDGEPVDKDGHDYWNGPNFSPDGAHVARTSSFPEIRSWRSVMVKAQWLPTGSRIAFDARGAMLPSGTSTNWNHTEVPIETVVGTGGPSQLARPSLSESRGGSAVIGRACARAPLPTPPRLGKTGRFAASEWSRNREIN